MKPFEIFRTGRHTSSKGATLSFSDADLSAIAAGYDTALHHAPIVVGHPKQDAPAYGWIDGLSVSGDRLVARPADIDTAFADLLHEKKFRKVSAAFYSPDSANNPTPGSYYLRHVGFLGAAVPAVKGLKPVEFADDDTVLVFADVELSESWRQAWAFDAAARMFRSLRDWLIETKDVEAADKVIPTWDLDQITQAAADLRADAERENRTAFSEQPKEPQMTKPEKTEEQRLADLAAREQEMATREATFAENERQARAVADAAFVDTIVKAGRLPIGLRATATAVFADLGDDELTFADGDETKKMSSRAAFRDMLEKLPVQVETGELAKGDSIDFADAEQVTQAVDAEMEAAKAKGETISPAAAMGRIQARAK